MTLPASGPLSFSAIQGEFGGTNPIALPEYYGRSGLPASGQISVADFYGKSAGTQYAITAGQLLSGGAMSRGFRSAPLAGPFGSMAPTSYNGISVYGIETLDPANNGAQTNFVIYFAGDRTASHPFTQVQVLDGAGNPFTFLESNASKVFSGGVATSFVWFSTGMVMWVNGNSYSPTISG
jgi:hypothetical protein